MEDLKNGLNEKGLIDFVKTCLLSGNNPRGNEALENLKWGIKQYRKHLILHGVSKSLNADELINSLGTPDVENEYIVKPDTDGTWWMEHKHVGSGEPLKQWLTGKP